MIKLIKKILRNRQNQIKDPLLKVMIVISNLNLKDLNTIIGFSRSIRDIKQRGEK